MGLLPRHPLSTTKLQNHTRPVTATTATRVATTRTWLLPLRQMRRQQVLLWSIAWRTGSLRGEMQSNWREVCERLDQCSLVLRVLRAVRLLPRRFADPLPALREGECGHARACEHHSKCDLAAEHPDCSSYFLLHRFICRPLARCESHGVECREKQKKKKKKKKKKKSKQEEKMGNGITLEKHKKEGNAVETKEVNEKVKKENTNKEDKYSCEENLAQLKEENKILAQAVEAKSREADEARKTMEEMFEAKLKVKPAMVEFLE